MFLIKKVIAASLTFVVLFFASAMESSAASNSYISVSNTSPIHENYDSEIYVRQLNKPIGQVCFKLNSVEVSPVVYLPKNDGVIRASSQIGCFTITGPVSDSEGDTALEIRWPTGGMTGKADAEVSFWSEGLSTKWKTFKFTLFLDLPRPDNASLWVQRDVGFTLVCDHWFPSADGSAWTSSVLFDGHELPDLNDFESETYQTSPNQGCLNLTSPTYKVGIHKYQTVFTRISDGKVVKFPVRKIEILKSPLVMTIPADRSISLGQEVTLSGRVTMVPGKANNPWPAGSLKGVKVNYRTVSASGVKGPWKTSITDKSGRFPIRVFALMNSKVEIHAPETETSSGKDASFRVTGSPWIRVDASHSMQAGKTYHMSVSTLPSFSGTCVEEETWYSLDGLELGRAAHVIEVVRGHGSFKMKAKFFGQVAGIVVCGGDRKFEENSVSFNRLSI